MEIKLLAHEDGLTKVNIAGSVIDQDETASVEALGGLLGQEGFARRTALRMVDVNFINSRGVGWLLICHKRFAEAGGRMLLYGVQPMPMRVLQMLRLHMLLEIVPSEAAIATRLAGAAP